MGTVQLKITPSFVSAPDAPSNDWFIAEKEIGEVILKSGNRYKSLYFGEVGEYTMDVLLVDGKADIQDRYGRIPGDWKTLNKWWDFIEKCRLYQGSRWNYSYCYWKYINEVDNTSSPRDSILQSDSLKGQFELEITSSTMQGATGSLTLQATFQIAEEKSRYFHAQINGDIQILSDSSWSKAGVTEIEQYEIVLENDTLWYRTEEGVVFFASAKIESFAAINLRAFVYPFEFPREGFPEGRDILGEILFHDEIIPSRPKVYGDTPSAIIHHSDDSITYLAGSYINNYLCLLSGGGFRDMNYFFGDYDQLYWNGREWYLDPYVKETSFSCKLLSFTPGD